MWLLILGGVTLVALIGVIYLINRIRKFQFVKKICKGKRSFEVLFSLALVLVAFAVLSLIWSSFNAIIVVIHLMLIWILCDLISLLFNRISSTTKKNTNNDDADAGQKKSTETDNGLYKAGIVAVICTIIYLAAGYFLDHGVWEKDYQLNTAKDIEQIRIVQIADLHIGTTFSGNDLNKYVERINSTGPDVVVITGDLCDDNTDYDNLKAGIEALSKLNTKYGTYFSWGNHDKGYYGSSRGFDADTIVQLLDDNGIVLLADDVKLIDERFYLIGRNDKNEESRGSNRASMSDLLKGLDTSKYMIVLDHQPNSYDEEAASKVDLVLSGHTHGGQFFPILKAGEWIGANDATYGYERRDVTDFIITSGIGNWELMFKTGCKSEYVVIDISNK